MKEIGRVGGSIINPEVSLDIISVCKDTMNNNSREEFHRIMPKIPEYVRDKYDSEDYDPHIASFGPYHHGLPRLKFVEDFKPKALHSFVRNTGRDEIFWLGLVKDIIGDLRRSYVEGSTDEYDDDAFARMMLQDVCLLFLAMRLETDSMKSPNEINRNLGGGAFVSLSRDSLLLENQIPYWFFKKILFEMYGSTEGKTRVTKYFNWVCHGIRARNDEASVEEENEPSHVLEAFKNSLIQGWKSPGKNSENGRSCSVLDSLINWVINKFDTTNISRLAQEKDEVEDDYTKNYYSFRSITELKSKGINIRPNQNNSFKNINFESGCFNGSLEFPVSSAEITARSICKNIIAYERTPNNYKLDMTFTAYIHFLKSLIQSPKDVEELQEKGIIINLLGSNEEVMKLYHDIHTFGFTCSEEFGDVCQNIQRHYNNKARTWFAEFVHSYFRSPWTFIALLVSLLLISLTLIQTYYAARPRRD